jgi:radical SAM superfamily enzyme YgiQ (UPF0313 family)
MPPVQPIILATLNAKYIHASLGLRYLQANMARHGGSDLHARTQLREFVISQKPQDIVEQLLALNPAVIGLGVYIWNIQESTQVARLLKALRPEVKLVIGGPEVSYEIEEQAICQLADHVITGWGDVSFPKLCKALIHGPKPLMKVIAGEQPALDQIEMPYAYYTDEDIAQRLLYVEASRGCPFKCEFCLSSLDKTAWPFDLDAFLAHMTTLYERGARHFKFVDRTFNLKIENSARILQFFLDRMSAELFVHFEVVPDVLPERLKTLIAQFPPGALQFEVGIQSFNPQVQARISRKQDNDKTADNIRWLLTQSQAHLHTDLIFGLPGETLDTFAQGFDRLVALAPHEIQFGILKRLRGTPIARHTSEHAMVYDPQAPYGILQNADIDYPTMQRIYRFARYWDVVANSGRFTQTLKILLGGAGASSDAGTGADSGHPSAFYNFLNWSDWLWQRTGKTHEFAQERLVDLLFEHFRSARQDNIETVRQALLADYRASGARSQPQCLQGLLEGRHGRQPASPEGAPAIAKHRAERQSRHALRGEIQKAAAAA